MHRNPDTVHSVERTSVRNRNAVDSSVVAMFVPSAHYRSAFPFPVADGKPSFRIHLQQGNIIHPDWSLNLRKMSSENGMVLVLLSRPVSFLVAVNDAVSHNRHASARMFSD